MGPSTGSNPRRHTVFANASPLLHATVGRYSTRIKTLMIQIEVMFRINSPYMVLNTLKYLK